MTEKGLRVLVRRGLADPRRGEIGLFAANGAYYLFLSLGPLTALILALLPYTPLTETRLLDGAAAYVPGPMRRLLYAVVRDVYAPGAAALSLSLVLELWSGARFLASVVRGVSALRGGRGWSYLRRRLLGAAYTALLAVFLLGNLTLLLFGERLLYTVGRRWPETVPLWQAVLMLRPGVFLGGLAAGDALLFRYAPGRSGPDAPALPGAVLAAGGWLLFTRLYSWALERFGLFGVYGSIAAVAASLYWMYVSLYILFLGAWFNTLLLPEEGMK